MKGPSVTLEGTEPVTVACDESGSEGENVVDSAHRVFCHGSTNLSLVEAEELVDRTRDELRTQAPELKSGQLLKPKARKVAQELFAPEGPLAGRCQMYLVDKQYFMVGKVIDLLIVEHAHHTGVDLYVSGKARDLAYDLFQGGPRALKSERWSDLLRSFNSLMRATQRGSVPKTSVAEFYDMLDVVKFESHRRKVSDILLLLARTRPQAEQFQAVLDDPESDAATLDPLLAALPTTIRTWYERTGAPVEVVHDQQVALTETTIRDTLKVLRSPGPDFRHLVTPVDARGITLVDSKSDARVQVADLVAGIGRRLGTQALSGAELVIEPADHIDRRSLWADNPSWQTLTGLPTVRS